MRKLNGKDLFAFLRVIKTTGASEEIKRVSVLAQKMQMGEKGEEEDKKARETKIRELGAELIFEVLGNCGSQEAEKAIWNFLSGPAEKTVSELEKMPLDELTVLIEKMVKENLESGDLARFFHSVAALMKSRAMT